MFLLGAIVLASIWGVSYLTNMPGKAQRSQAPLSADEREIEARLRRHVEVLASEIGGRSAGAYSNLVRAADYIASELRSFGYNTNRQPYDFGGQSFENIQATLPGTTEPGSIVVIGAHYDTAGGLPGANDNGSGVAATLELARIYVARAQTRTLRWVFFANEEPPFFQTPGMGSYVYAKACRERDDDIAAMLSLETIGYYSSQPSSQRYPVSFHPGYPGEGDFLGFVSDIRSARLLRTVVKAFRAATPLPLQGAAAPGSIPGVGWSDHWSFWQFGYRAVMVTDTAPFRYPYYHTREDTPDKLDYPNMARAVTGLSAVVRQLASK